MAKEKPNGRRNEQINCGALAHIFKTETLSGEYASGEFAGAYFIPYKSENGEINVTLAVYRPHPAFEPNKPITLCLAVPGFGCGTYNDGKGHTSGYFDILREALQHLDPQVVVVEYNHPGYGPKMEKRKNGFTPEEYQMCSIAAQPQTYQAVRDTLLANYLINRDQSVAKVIEIGHSLGGLGVMFTPNETPIGRSIKFAEAPVIQPHDLTMFMRFAYTILELGKRINYTPFRNFSTQQTIFSRIVNNAYPIWSRALRLPPNDTHVSHLGNTNHIVLLQHGQEILNNLDEWIQMWHNQPNQGKLKAVFLGQDDWLIYNHVARDYANGQWHEYNTGHLVSRNPHVAIQMAKNMLREQPESYL